MSFDSYAQNFEDVMLRRALANVEKGSYIDVGAQDPVFDSVSLLFYELGWRGVHVEATPIYANKLRDARPDEVVIEAAVSNVEGLIQFHEIPDTGLSTGREDVAEEHRKSGWPSTIITVPTIRLEHVLQIIDGPIHWLKIDVEGMEGAALESWGQSEVRPWILVIEATFPNSQRPTHDDWSNEVEKRGYEEVYFDGLSRFYLHRDQSQLRDAFEAPPNVFDGFQLSDHHFSTGGLAHRYAEDLDRRDRAYAGLSEARQCEQTEIEALKAEVELRDRALQEAIDRETEAGAAILTHEKRERAIAAETAAHQAEISRLHEQLHAWTQRLQEARQAFDASVGEQAARYEVEIVRRQEQIESAKQRLEEAQQSLSHSRDAHSSLTQQLLASEQEHRKTTEGFWRDRQGAEYALRAALELREDALSEALRHSEVSATAARIELARANELTLHLQVLTERTREEAALMRSQLAVSQQSAAASSTRFDKVVQEMQCQLDDANARADLVERELKQKLADATAAAENNEQLMKRELADAFAWGHGLEEEMQWRVTEAEARADLLSQRTASLLAESNSQFNEVVARRDYADRLIKRVLEEPQSLWQRLGNALRLDSASSADLELAAWLQPLEPTPHTSLPLSMSGTENSMPSPNDSHRRNPYLRADTLTDLLAWDDVDFVRCAYATMLDRQPEPEGEAFYTNRIRTGFSKLGIVRQLRNAVEIEHPHRVNIDFDRALRRYSFWAKPIVRLFAPAFLSDTRSARMARAIAHNAVLFQRQQQFTVNQMEMVTQSVRSFGAMSDSNGERMMQLATDVQASLERNLQAFEKRCAGMEDSAQALMAAIAAAKCEASDRKPKSQRMLTVEDILALGEQF